MIPIIPSPVSSLNAWRKNSSPDLRWKTPGCVHNSDITIIMKFHIRDMIIVITIISPLLLVIMVISTVFFHLNTTSPPKHCSDPKPLGPLMVPTALLHLCCPWRVHSWHHPRDTRPWVFSVSWRKTWEDGGDVDDDYYHIFILSYHHIIILVLYHIIILVLMLLLLFLLLLLLLLLLLYWSWSCSWSWCWWWWPSEKVGWHTNRGHKRFVPRNQRTATRKVLMQMSLVTAGKIDTLVTPAG